MYSAQTERTRREISLATLDRCLRLLKEASSDNDTFSTLLSITNHVRSKTFTAEDQRTVLEAAGLGFISRLIISQSVPSYCVPHYYKCVGLSILSAWTVEPVIAQHPAVTDFLAVVNQVISPESLFKTCSHPDSLVIYEQMCRDSEEIVSNLTKHEPGIDRLLQSNTLELLLEYSHSPACQNVPGVLESLSTVVMSRGEGRLNFDPDKLLVVMNLAVERLGQESDINEKTQFARILTAFFTGLSTVEVSVQMDWVRKLVLLLRKLIAVKLAPDDSQDVLGLVGALVNSAGPQVFSSEVSGDDNFLKSVVARVSVEVYMQLDCIHVHNACERYPVLDRVYKLLSSVVQFMAESGEGIDSNSIIIIYRKLVDISETIMEFLFSVSHQEIQFPKNHTVVLISVRMLAAMLAEITEEVTPRLLDLLPFFNLLCQNVEFSDDVVTEVKNTSQGALETIKSMAIDACLESSCALESGEVKLSPELSSEEHNVDFPSSEFHGVSSSINETINHADQSDNTADAFGHLHVADLDACEAESRRFKAPSLPVTTANDLHTEGQYCENDKLHENNSFPEKGDIMSQINGDISLSQENVESFKTFQASITSLKAKPQSVTSRKVSLVKNEKLITTDQALLEQWKPMPDDILGYLLPAYMCLLDNQEVVDVMSRSGTFQTVVTFLETSLSHLLKNKSSGYPESSTVNALSVIELVYTNSPVSAESLDCLEELFDITFMSLPNLLTQPHPSPLVCLKLLDVFLTAYRIQMRAGKKKSSLPQLKHSQSQLFKAAVEYLSSFYEIRQHRGKPISLHIKKEFRVVWPLAEESWSGCIAGLCTLVRCVEELQDSLVTSQMFPEFLSFLASFEGLHATSEAVHELVKSMFSLIESAAEGSTALCELMFRNRGQIIAKKFDLKKLDKCLQSLSQ